MASRTTEARYAPEIPLGCPCAFVVEATSTNGHISRFISENMTTQWTSIPLMVDSVPGWIEPREGTVIDSWQSVEPILQLTGWSLFVDHIDFRPTILNRCDVVPENVSTTRVTTIQSLNSYTDGALILRLTSTENPLLWNECRILFLDRNIPVGSLTTENQVSQVSNTGVMVNLSVQDIGFNIVQDGSINWTHSLLVGGDSLPLEVLEQGRKIRINTSTPGEHVVRVTIEDIAGNTLRLELIIEIRPVEPLMQILVDGIPHPDSEILKLENGTTLSVKFGHPVFNEADYDVRWSLNEVVVATGYNVDIEQTWFNHQGDKLELEVEHPEGKAVHVVNITLQSGNKELMAEQSEPTDAWIFGLSVIQLLALLVLLVTVGLIFRWLARYHYTVPSWGNEPPSGQ